MKQNRHAPKINKNPKWQRENQVFKENIRKQRADNSISHKAEIGKGKSVGIDVLGVAILGTELTDQNTDGNEDKLQDQAEEQDLPRGGKACDGEILDEGSQDKGGNKDHVLKLRKNGGS